MRDGASGVRGRRQWWLGTSLAAMLLVVTGCNFAFPDNRPTPLAGETNGDLSPSVLTAVTPDCTAFVSAAPDLVDMIAAAAAAGIVLDPAECYRDYATQVYWRGYWCSLGICQNAAVPGTSNHGWGKAVDFRDMEFGSPAYDWLEDNAWQYNWNHPGWAEPGSSAPEAWHWEWVGDGGMMFCCVALNNGEPFGAVDRVQPIPNGVSLAGWAIDPDEADPTVVHVYVDSLGYQVPADAFRPDVASAYPGLGDRHGFNGTVPASVGVHTVCVYAINIAGPGSNQGIGCQTVQV